MRPSADFHARRLQRVQSELRALSLDALLVLNPVNTYYLTGFWYMPIATMERPAAVFVPAEGEAALIVSLDVAGHADGPLSKVVDEVWVYREYPWVNGTETFQWIANEIADAGYAGARLGVEDNFTPVNDATSPAWYERVRRAFDGDVSPAGALVGRLRMIKEPEEIELIRRSCSYADELVRATSREIRASRSEEDVGAVARMEIEQRMRRELEIVVPSLATGQICDGTPRSYHDTRSHSTAKGFQPGIPIIINCFTAVGGYHAESERCGLLGQATRRQRELFELAMDSQQRALAAVRPGVTCASVDAVANEYITKNGFDYLYGVGHGIGLLGHEPPWVREGEPTELQPGMCITVEPGLAVPGEGSFHCSQTVLVTDTGYEPLTVADEIHALELH